MKSKSQSFTHKKPGWAETTTLILSLNLIEACNPLLGHVDQSKNYCFQTSFSDFINWHQQKNDSFLTTYGGMVPPVKANSSLSTCSGISLQTCALYHWVNDMAAVKDTTSIEIVWWDKRVAFCKDTESKRKTNPMSWKWHLKIARWRGIELFVRNIGRVENTYLSKRRSQMLSGLHGVTVGFGEGSGPVVGGTDGFLQLGWYMSSATQ